MKKVRGNKGTERQKRGVNNEEKRKGKGRKG